MGKTRIIIEKCATRFRTELQVKLDTLPPKARLAVIAGMLVPFPAGCLYTTATALAGFGESGKAPEILSLIHVCRRRPTPLDHATGAPSTHRTCDHS